MARKTLLRGGTVLTMDREIGEFSPGDVLIVGDRIEAVAPRIDAEADVMIDMTDRILLPGLIDAHTHLWQTPIRGVAAGAWAREYFSIVHPFAARLRPVDTFNATHGGAAEALSHGVTTIFDFCHAVNSPEHADASVDALERSGIRAVFGYGLRDRPEVPNRVFTSLDDRIADIRRLHEERHGTAGGRIQLAVAMNNPEHLDRDAATREFGIARELGVRSTVHSDLAGQVIDAFERGLLGPDVLWVHCLGIADAELDLMREHGGVLVSCPEIEANLMAATPVLGRAMRRDVPVALGIDVPSVVNNSLHTQLRVTFAIDRMLDAQREHDQLRTPTRTRWSPVLDAKRTLELATVDAAKALGLSEKIGSIAPGKQADIVAFADGLFGRGAGDPANHVIFQTSRAEVDLVLVAGEARVRDGALVDSDPAALRDALDESCEYLTGRAGVEWKELSAADRATYEETLGRPAEQADLAQH